MKKGINNFLSLIKNWFTTNELNETTTLNADLDEKMKTCEKPEELVVPEVKTEVEPEVLSDDLEEGFFTDEKRIVEEIKNRIEDELLVWKDNQFIFNMPFDEFIGNKIKDLGQILVRDGEDLHKVFISLPKHAMEEFSVKVKAIYDDGFTKSLETDRTDSEYFTNHLVINEPIEILSPDRCYLVKIIISIINNENKKKRYDLDLTPVYDFDLREYVEPIDYFELYKDLEYTDEIKQVVILESSAYKVMKEDVPEGKVFIHPNPEDGKYMLRTFDLDNNIIEEKTFEYHPEECWIDHHESVTKVVLYKLSDKNVDAVTIYLKK